MQEMGLPRETPFTVVRVRSLRTPRHQRIPLGLSRALAEIGPNVVIAHGLASMMTLRAAAIRRRPFCLLVDCHNSSANTKMHGAVRVGALKAYRHTLGAFIRRRADCIIAVGPPEGWFAAAATGLTAKSIPLIPLGADAGVFQPLDEVGRATVRKELGIPSDAICVVHAGRLVAGKGLPGLAAAVSALGESRAVLLLVGTMDRVMQQDLAPYRSVIIHRPFVPKHTLARYFGAADIGAWLGNPSISVLEAMACGLPILAARSPHFEALFGTDEIYATGLDETVERLRVLADSDVVRSELGARNRDRILASHSWHTISEQFLQLCDRSSNCGGASTG